MSYYLSPIQRIVGFSFPKGGRFIAYVQDDTIKKGNYLFDGAPGAWTAESTFSVAGWADWKGWNPQDILTWEGPDTRYWLPYNKFGYSRWVYRYGQFWARIPDSYGYVIGCGIMSHGGQRFLNAMVLRNNGTGTVDWRIYQRLEAETYPNHSDYDAGTNPLGWKLIYNETAAYDSEVGVPRTIFPFNASGTECQGLSGEPSPSNLAYPRSFKTLTKFTISGETVSVTRSDARGSWTRRNVYTVNHNYNIDLQYGVLVEAAPGVDTNYYVDEECLENDTCGCVHGKSQYEWSADQNWTNDHTVTYSKDTIVCVDYVGDTEVLGTFGLVQTATSSRNETKQFSRGTESWFPCGGSYSEVVDPEPWEWSETNNEVYGNFVRYFSFGDFSLCLEGLTGSHTRTGSASGVNESGTGSVSGLRHQDTVFDRQVLFADMRYTHIVYSEHVKSSTVTETGSGAVPFDVAAHNYEESRRAQVAVIHGQDPIDLWVGDESVSEFTDPDFFSVDRTNNPEPIWLKDTYQETLYDESASEHSYFDQGEMFVGYIHERLRDYSATTHRHSCATDMANNVFASFMVWEDREPDTPRFWPVSSWNYLTGGDPVALTGLTGPFPRFYPIVPIAAD